MSANNHSVTNILAQALKLPVTERSAYLDQVCQDQPEVHAEVASLLAIEERAGGQLSGPIARIDLDANDDVDSTDSFAPGTRLDHYILEAEIGEGGMGTVHRARQVEPVERPVAIKLVKPGMDTRAVLARFDLERRTLARLSHPNIATLLDAGRTPAGRPYLVMELVEGEPITRFSNSRDLSPAARIGLLCEACAGVRHAHRRGVLHRDIKSTNVLVAEVDGRPFVKVIDFGIARLLETDPDTTEGGVTLASGGRSPGTPRSMAPEQREAGGIPDVRTDVYALGVLLVDLFASRDSPDNPNTIADRDLPGDLRWVARRCLEANPDDRYDGVDALLADLERWTRNEPTVAGPPSLARRVRVAWIRHRLPLSVAAVVVAALSVGLGVALDARATAQTDARRAMVTNTFLADLFDRIDPETARTQDTTLLRTMLDDAAARVESELGDEPAIEAVGRAVVGRAYSVIGESRLAEPHLRRAIELDQRPEVRRELQTRLVGVLKELGELDQAGSLASDILDSLRKQRGPNDADTLRAANNLATVRMRQQRYEEAAELLQEVLRRKEFIAPEDSDSISVTRSNLATCLSALRRDEEALLIREELLTEVEATHGPDSPQMLIALNNLATSIERVGKEPERAIELRQRALSLAIALHGDRHPNTLVARNNLAMLLRSRGELQEAESMFRASLPIMLETIGDGHPFTIATGRNLAATLIELNRASEALPFAKSAEESALSSLGAGHPLRGLTVLTHADVLHAVGRTEEALRLLEAGTERLGDSVNDDWEQERAARQRMWTSGG